MALNPLVQRYLQAVDTPSIPDPIDGTPPAVKSTLQVSPVYQGPGTRMPGSGAGSTPSGGWGAAPADVGGTQALVKMMAAQKGWTGREWDALYDLVRRESGWNPSAQNKSSGAYGLFQFMPMHWKQGGYLPWGTAATPEQQAAAGLRYIADRYGTPSAALSFWLSRRPINGRDVGNWY